MPFVCASLMIKPYDNDDGPYRADVQVIQSPTLVKLVHPTCTSACKCGTSWRQPMHAKLVWASIGILLQDWCWLDVPKM